MLHFLPQAKAITRKSFLSKLTSYHYGMYVSPKYCICYLFMRSYFFHLIYNVIEIYLLAKIQKSNFAQSIFPYRLLNLWKNLKKVLTRVYVNMILKHRRKHTLYEKIIFTLLFLPH